jgi:hypothetical protein
MARYHAGIALVAAFTLCAGGRAARLPNSPYPVCTAGLNASRVLYHVDETTLSQDDIFTASSLQGLLSRRVPRVYRTNGPGSDYGLWLNLTQAAFGVQVNESFVSDVCGLARLFQNEIGGYVLANLNDNSTAAAFTACAAAPFIAFTAANQACAASLGLKLAADLRGQDVADVIAAYNGTGGFTYNTHVSALQDPTKFSCLGDYTVFSGAINFWAEDMSSPLADQVLGAMTWPAAVFGWGVSEDGTIAAVSGVGGYVHASDWAKNLDVLTNFDLAPFTQSGGGGGAPVPAPAATGSFVAAATAPPAQVHTVCFVMTDGDNVQWLLNDFATGSDWWGSPDRGRTNVGWTLTPALSELAPVIMDYLYATAANGSEPGLPGHDYFVAAASGVGYIYPDLLTPAALAEYTPLTGAYMANSGMRVVNVLAENYSPAAAASYLAQPNIDGVLWYDYDSYSELQGNITFFNGKPVIGGRFQLWDGAFMNTSELILALLAQPKTPNVAAGYSLVPVHVWSNNVTEVAQVADALAAAGGFQVVTPDVFVNLITANIAH